MLKLGVTGGLASGKSTVCSLFEKRGAYVVSADVIVHQLLSPQTSLGQKIITWLGPEIVENKNINRSKVASLVFQDRRKLEQLESLLHPAVMQVLEAEAAAAQREQAPLFVAEVPLLFESGQQDFFDYTLAVRAPLALRQQRYAKDDFAARTERQLADDARPADFVINNSGDLAQLEAAVDQIFSQLTTTQG